MSGKDNTKVMVDEYAGGTAKKEIDLSSVGDKLQGMVGIGSRLDELKEEEEKNRPLTRWERKKKRILGESKALQNQFMMGFMMGGMVGGLMGGLTGTYFAIQYR